MPVNGGYELLAQIGRGSTAVVYGARDTQVNRFIAVKLLDRLSELTPERKQRLQRDLQAVAALRHPHIAAVYESGEYPKGWYIAMEFLTGCDLRRCIAEKRSISMAEKMQIMARICEALRYAHDHGAVHGRLKPSKIFLQDNGSPKLLDFAGSHWYRLPAARSAPVHVEADYMAPEEIMGGSPDVRSDLFALAVIFFEFLVGVHPFSGSFVARRIVETEPDCLADYDPAIPQKLQDVFKRALAKRKEHRFQNAAQFGLALRDAWPPLGSRVPLLIFDDSPTAPQPAEVRPELPPEKAQEKAPENSAQPVRMLEAPAIPPPPQQPQVAALPPRRALNVLPLLRRISIWAVGLALVVICSAMLLRSTRSVAARGSVAHAVIQDHSATLFEAPSNNSRPIRVLQPGTRVNVLETITSPLQAWILVQYVSPDGKSNSKPGYVRNSLLSEWATDDPEMAWRLLLKDQPDDTADPPQVVRFEKELEQIKVRFPGLRARADLKLARLYVEAAHHGRDTNDPADAVPEVLQGAKDFLDDLPGDLTTAEANERDALNREMVQLSATAPVPAAIPVAAIVTPAPPAPAPDIRVRVLLGRIRALYDEGQYSQGLSLIHEVLLVDPGNEAALKQSARFRAAMEFEKRFDSTSR